MGFDATVDTLVIKFDLGKYKEFLCINSLQHANTFRTARRIIPSSSVKRQHSLPFPPSAAIRRAQSQVPVPKKTTTMAISSTSLRSTATSAIRFATGIVKSLGLVYTNPNIGSSKVGTSLSIPTSNNSFISLTNKEIK